MHETPCTATRRMMRCSLSSACKAGHASVAATVFAVAHCSLPAHNEWGKNPPALQDVRGFSVYTSLPSRALTAAFAVTACVTSISNLLLLSSDNSHPVFGARSLAHIAVGGTCFTAVAAVM